MSALTKRSLGKTESSALGFGCMSLTPGFYGDNVDMQESEKTLRAALDLGVTLLNTADFYTSMTSGETSQNIKLIGKVLKDYKRENVVIVMKFGPWIEGGFSKNFDLSPAGVRKRVDDALKILGTDYIDVLVWRSGPPDKHQTPLEDTAKGLKEVLESGKVKALGISEFSADDIKKVHAIAPISAVELEWSLFSRDSEKDVIPTARSIGAGIIAYAPMGRGLLTGKYDPSQLSDGDFRKTMGGKTKGEALDKNQLLARAVAGLAEKKGCTAGQLAIAWVLAKGNDVVPIPGTKRTKYLEENLKALDVKLSEKEIQELEEVVPLHEVAGSRYD